LREEIRRGHAERPVSGDEAFARGAYHVLANNASALDAAAQEAGSRGCKARIMGPALSGEARDAGTRVASAIRAETSARRPDDPPLCLLWGGETTVTVRGPGMGGRNQELALAALVELRTLEGRYTVAAMGTDGRDGPTDAAGAWFDDTMVRAASRDDLRPQEFLDANDSYRWFERSGGLLRTGATGTNVADIVAALVT
jgi:glycerate-2-kinase